MNKAWRSYSIDPNTNHLVSAVIVSLLQNVPISSDLATSIPNSTPTTNPTKTGRFVSWTSRYRFPFFFGRHQIRLPVKVLVPFQSRGQAGRPGSSGSAGRAGSPGGSGMGRERDGNVGVGMFASISGSPGRLGSAGRAGMPGGTGKGRERLGSGGTGMFASISGRAGNEGSAGSAGSPGGNGIGRTKDGSSGKLHLDSAMAWLPQLHLQGQDRQRQDGWRRRPRDAWRCHHRM